ncbi:MAG: helix-turn-helix domain-containing protein [Candidatus Treponema excrementipullorum]|uniref:Helix-turn-helix domain-containing protein n=1 Tax=Candidatus Treponema excrementipullorum TaxID=2838768 RepID=A0A9E2L1E6_9SPIR|nr:helix-turn-helix domain-containing protein [Candidatus Treponema excrementipullorum]
MAKDYFISTIAQEHIAKENGVQESESERAQSNQLNNESPLRSLSGDSDTSNIPQNEEKSSGKANDSFKGTNVERAVEKYASESILKSVRKRVNINTFCSKDTNKYLINGVYYDEGKKVATNGKYLLVEDAEYPESYEGKIIADKKHKAALEKGYEKKKAEYEKKLAAAKVSGEGTMEYIEARKSDPGEPFVNENGEVKGPYPNYKNVIPDTSSKNYSDITDDFNTNIDKIEKLAYMGKKLEGITKEPTRIKIFGTYFDSSQISDILCVAKNKGGLTGVHFFDEPKATKVAVFEGKGFKVVVMPMRYEYGDNYLDVASGNYEGNQSDEVKDFLKGDADREQRKRKEKKIAEENEKIIEEGIESMQVNGGRSDAAMEADYEYEQFPAPEMEETEEETFGFENFTAEALLHLAEISPEAYESLKKEYEQRTGLSADEYLKKAGDKERQEKKESLISQRLKSLLEAQEMTIQELAIKAGVTEAAMLRYINGERIPRGAILLNVANAFGVSVDQITGKEFPFTVGEEIPLDTFTSSYGGENWIIEKINENNVQLGRSTDNIVIQHEGKVMSKEDFLEAVQAIHPELVNTVVEKNPPEQKPDIATSFVLEKLKSVGIEVITDKNEFEKILEYESVLQKMATSNINTQNYFTATEVAKSNFAAQLDRYAHTDIKNPLELIDIGNITPVMKLIGIPDLPIKITLGVITKALREEPLGYNEVHGHGLTFEDLKMLPQLLADPIMIFKSDSPTRKIKDSYVFFTEHKDFRGRSIIVPLAVNQKYGRLVINKITSIYGRNHEIRYVKDNIVRGNLVYFDKKRSLEWERECKVQFLTQVLPKQGHMSSILTKERLVNFISSRQLMISDGTTYGFAYNGKIYLNPDFLNSNVAVHEYTHLWDKYIQNTNPELWERGKEAFKKTSLWEQVKNDPSYTDITGDDDLILSECHARICGEIAQSVLEKIAQEDGQIAKDAVIDWDKETWTYIAQNFTQDIASFIEVKDFMNLPIKDLMNEKIISYEQVTPAKENDKNKSDNLEAEKQLLSQFMPPEQLFTTLDLLAGEEGSFFAGKIKEIATAIEKAPKIYETDGMKEHPVILRYFHPTGTETLVCEIGMNGEAFGYQVINGDWVNSEFGYLDINEIKNIPGMEIDFHFPENMSIERWLYTQAPEHFRQYADLFEQPTQESPVPYPVQEQLNQQSPAIEIAFDPQHQPVKDNNISEVNGQDQTETQFFSQSFNLEGKTSTEKVKEITEKLKTGVNEIFESGQYEQYLKVMSKFHDYSTNNTILIALQRPDATRVAGFTTWKNEFQRSVKKGEKGIKILAPMFFKKEHQEKDVTDSETHSSENHEQEENEEQIITRFKVVNVFDICQTEGKELPGLGVDALKGDVEHYEAFYHSLEKTSPVPMAFEAIKDASHGYYDLVDKRIAIKAGLSQLQTIKTAIHEIAHATLHADKNSNTDRSTAEVQAESIAYTVCSYYGLDTSDYSFGYVAGWSRGKEIKELKDSLEIIRKTSSQIITDIDKHFSQIQEKQVIKEKQKTAFAQLELFSREELSNTPSIRKLMIDQALNREHITAGKAALRKYSESVLSGKQEGLWKSFYKFKTKGVFDIVGSKITLNKEGTLTDTSWNQLHTALKIYRDKRFETFRYLFVDNKGMIKDQLTLCSYLPNRTVATLPGKNIIPNIIKHAEETQTRIILAHNHPSGSTSPSFEDVLTTQKLKRIFTNSRGKSLLLGHIILDHDTAEIYDNSKANWYTIQTNKTNKDPLTKNDPLAKTELYSSLLLNSVCRQINETDTWKAKGFVPLVFVSGDKKVSAIKMYPESFFAGSQEDVLKELQHIGSQTGSNWCFPIVQNRKDISQNCTKNIRRLFEKKCFMDYMIEKEIGTELNSSYGGGIFDAISAEERQKRIKIESTFCLDKNNNTIATNTGVLICNEENEVKENTLPEKLFTTKEIKSGQSHTGILKESYLVSQNFFPPMTEKDGTISIYCSSKDLNMPVYALNPNEPVKVNMTKKQVAVLLDTAIKTHILKVKNTKDFKIILPEKSNPNPDFAKMLMSVTPGISYEGIKKEYNKIFNSVSKEMNALRIQVCKSQSPSRPLPPKRVYSGGMEY